jgi:hypothetical protein
MNRLMIRKFLLLLFFPALLLGNLYVNPEQKEAFPYVDLGLGPLVPAPTIGVGYRLQSEKQGFDLAARLSTVVVWNVFKLSALYLYYPRPNLDSQFYVGLGGATEWVHWSSEVHWGVSAEWIVGKQFTNRSCQRRFWQIQTGLPTYFFQPIDAHYWNILPFATFSYGFIF